MTVQKYVTETFKRFSFLYTAIFLSHCFSIFFAVVALESESWTLVFLLSRDNSPPKMPYRLENGGAKKSVDGAKSRILISDCFFVQVLPIYSNYGRKGALTAKKAVRHGRFLNF